jgi:hypothetical protein
MTESFEEWWEQNDKSSIDRNNANMIEEVKKLCEAAYRAGRASAFQELIKSGECPDDCYYRFALVGY